MAKAKRICDDEPFNPSTNEADHCTGCGPKNEPCVCQQMEFDFMSETVSCPSDLPDEAGQEPDTEFDSRTCSGVLDLSPCASKIITIEDRRRYMEELDGILCDTLMSIIKSGKATPGHLRAAVQYLKDKGITLPEMAKRERMAKDKEFLTDIDLPFNA